MPGADILLLEDEESIRRAVRVNLEAEGFRVREHASARSAWEDVRNAGSPQLGIFDVMLPGELDGIALCQKLREARFEFPVIFLTARDTLEDKLAGFRAGGDDYLTKPFDLEELLARVGVQLRRNAGARSEVSLGEWLLDLAAATAVAPDGETVRFNEREVAILRLLVERRGTPVSRSEILDRAWGVGEFPTNRTIDNYIVKFRKLFEADPNQPRLFVTRHGVGYELAPHD